MGVTTEPTDPILVQRALYARLANLGQPGRVSPAAAWPSWPSSAGFATDFAQVGRHGRPSSGLVGACVVLPPAIVAGYAVKAAEREDRKAGGYSLAPMSKAAVLVDDRPTARGPHRRRSSTAPHAGEVLVRMAASGVCHSDLSMQNGTMLTPTPVVLGHEGAGVIEAVGDEVTDLASGDHVVISWVPQCGSCYFCERGQPEICESTQHERRHGVPARRHHPSSLGRHRAAPDGGGRDVLGAERDPRRQRHQDPRRPRLEASPRSSAAACSPESGRR